MLKLEPLSAEPFWLDVLPRVRIQFRPVSVAAMLIARGAAGEALKAGGEQATIEAGAAFTRALAHTGIVAWEGIGDAKGKPVDVDEQVCLRGNHEELMWFANRRVDWSFGWLLNGGIATRRSYAGDRARLDRHLDWIETLPVTHREGDYLFVHAGIVPGRPLEQQRPKDLVWIRDRFLRDDRDHGFVVVHGHRPVRGGPDVRPNRINLDTGAAYGGPLTCAVLDSKDPQKRSFLTATLRDSIRRSTTKPIYSATSAHRSAFSGALPRPSRTRG